jgi:GNAT superfamily N-acetyltransferase
MSIIDITHLNKNYLLSFIKNDFPITFRYFNNKSVEQIIQNHCITLLYLENETPLGYAHIDYDIINDKYWFGICVLSSHYGKGIGTQLINKILEYFKKSDIDTLHLTVDKTNTVAYNMYIKNGFKLQRETDNIYIMSLVKSNILYLPVSFGEAIDKLTILDIKMNKITDSRKKDVEVEYNKLQTELKNIIETINFYYDALKQINLQIWDDQDNFRYSSDESEKTHICKKIIEDNDARFRIKNKINHILQSHLKEQKGYNPKVFIINYIDNKEYNITLHSIIKYQSIFNDKIIINCNSTMLSTLQKYYNYDTSIEIQSNSNIYIPDDYIYTLKSMIHNKVFYNFIENLKNKDELRL